MMRTLKMEAEEMAHNLQASRAGMGGKDASEKDEEISILQEELEEARMQAEEYKKKLLELRVAYRKLGGK